MRIAAEFGHKNGEDILRSPKFAAAYEEFRAVLEQLPAYRAAKVKKTSPDHVIAPGAMNHWLDNELCIKRDWDWHPLIIEADPTDTTGKSNVRSDFRKSRIEVEVQFGNVARYAYDVYKMAISLAQDHADVGLQVVCTKRFAAITGGNIAYFERVKRELERSRLTLMVPLVVLGIEPEDWDADKYPPEADAPNVTADDINAARRRRGLAPVPDDGGDDTGVPLDVLRELAARVA
ncbi:MAG TPA: BglII/BstYI family type II restriction endonuclease [Candidatus Limnocylindrales bacterium]|nr:BglII/BstYI family type II restriction endonuclease [Candidatus Limnocylindrales bacterium]